MKCCIRKPGLLHFTYFAILELPKPLWNGILERYQSHLPSLYREDHTPDILCNGKRLQHKRCPVPRRQEPKCNYIRIRKIFVSVSFTYIMLTRRELSSCQPETGDMCYKIHWFTAVLVMVFRIRKGAHFASTLMHRVEGYLCMRNMEWVKWCISLDPTWGEQLLKIKLYFTNISGSLFDLDIVLDSWANSFG